MGQRQDKDKIVYDDDCLACFEEGKTPKYVYVRFSMLENCPDVGLTPPNDRVFKLTQHDTRPCEYKYEIAPWRVWFSFNNPPTLTAWLRLFDSNDNIYFDDMPPTCPKEGFVFYNDMQVCGGPVGAVKGIAVITWQLQTIALLKALNMKALSDIFMEMRPLVDGNLVYKFCRLEDATNIAIEFEPD